MSDILTGVDWKLQQARFKLHTDLTNHLNPGSPFIDLDDFKKIKTWEDDENDTVFVCDSFIKEQEPE